MEGQELSASPVGSGTTTSLCSASCCPWGSRPWPPACSHCYMVWCPVPLGGRWGEGRRSRDPHPLGGLRFLSSLRGGGVGGTMCPLRLSHPNLLPARFSSLNPRQVGKLGSMPPDTVSPRKESIPPWTWEEVPCGSGPGQRPEQPSAVRAGHRSTCKSTGRPQRESAQKHV